MKEIPNGIESDDSDNDDDNYNENTGAIFRRGSSN